jgi:diketogulonate reductase-like aldo/keto reductase
MFLKNVFKFIFIMSFIYGANGMAFEMTVEGTLDIDGIEYPAVGFGTYLLKEEIGFKAVSEAAEIGYRIIDTATFYGNFEPIGQALKKYGRENFYLISKVWPTNQAPELLNEDIKMTLEQLQTHYLDAYLLHWPNSQIPIEDTLGAMEKLRQQGKIRHIGLSNVTVNHLKRALETNIPIAWVQVEMHPLFYDADLLEYCRKKGISVQAWSPLGRGPISHDAFLIELGHKYEKTASQIALKWILQHHCIPLPSSKNKQHMLENLQIMDFTLSQEDMHEMNERAKLGKRERVTKEDGLDFTDEFDFSYQECWPNVSV